MLLGKQEAQEKGRNESGKMGCPPAVCAWSCERTYLCTQVQKPGKDTGWVPFSPYFLISMVETGSLARLETCHFGQAGWLGWAC